MRFFTAAIVLSVMAALAAAQVTCTLESGDMCVSVGGNWYSFCPSVGFTLPPVPSFTLPTFGPITIPTFGPITLPTFAPPTTTRAPTPAPPVTPVPTTTTPAPTPVPPTTTLAPPTPVPTTPIPTPAPPTPAPTPAPQHGPATCVNLKLHQVRELDSASVAIPDSVYNTFLTTSTLATPYTVLPCSNPASALTNGVCTLNANPVQITYVGTTTSLGSLLEGYSGTLTVTVAIPKETSTLRFQGEEIVLTADQAVFALDLQYNFCGTVFSCDNNKIGASVEVSFLAEGVDAKQVSVSATGLTVSAADGSDAGQIKHFSKYAATNNLVTSAQNSIVTTSAFHLNSVLTYRFTGPFQRAELNAIVSLPSSAPATVVSLLLLCLAVLLL